jgi:hypothetical protein
MAADSPNRTHAHSGTSCAYTVSKPLLSDQSDTLAGRRIPINLRATAVLLHGTVAARTVFGEQKLPHRGRYAVAPGLAEITIATLSRERISSRKLDERFHNRNKRTYGERLLFG